MVGSTKIPSAASDRRFRTTVGKREVPSGRDGATTTGADVSMAQARARLSG